MRNTVPEKLEQGRLRTGPYASTPQDDLMGAFLLMGPKGAQLQLISSGVDTEFSWEHVSVSVESRTPNWQEMCFVKDLFWRDDECVVQYHPPASEYVNVHPNCLHLWKPVGAEFPAPPSYLIGPKSCR